MSLQDIVQIQVELGNSNANRVREKGSIRAFSYNRIRYSLYITIECFKNLHGQRFTVISQQLK